jgi:hypothetical protein
MGAGGGGERGRRGRGQRTVGKIRGHLVRVKGGGASPGSESFIPFPASNATHACLH